MALLKKKEKEILPEEILGDEQTTFNEDGLDVLCADDTVVENLADVDAEEADAKEEEKEAE